MSRPRPRDHRQEGRFPRVSGECVRVSPAQILEPAIFRLWDINGVVGQNVLVGD